MLSLYRSKKGFEVLQSVAFQIIHFKTLSRNVSGIGVLYVHAGCARHNELFRIIH